MRSKGHTFESAWPDLSRLAEYVSPEYNRLDNLRRQSVLRRIFNET